MKFHLMTRDILVLACALFFLPFSPQNLFAESIPVTTDVGEMNKLIKPHLPHPLPDKGLPKDTFNVSIPLSQGRIPVVFSIPGFHSLGCVKCHEGKSLHLKAAERMRRVLEKLKKMRPKLTEIPLRQYIIQSWPDMLLTPDQLAHTTFDTIRISPAAIIIDSKAYQEATHLHESLHLTQKFVGPANELEAYSLNITSDPRFLLLNFPYFEDTIKTFFIEDFSEVLNDFYARPIREQLSVPQETQWFLAPFKNNRLENLRQVIAKISPLLDEVSKLNRNYPKEVSYLSEKTGNPALLLEIVAAKHLLKPNSEISEETRRRAFSFFDLQMNKKDNIQLGYKINRKKEAFLFIESQMTIKDPAIHLRLYFEYIKKRFVKPSGEINVRIAEKKDFNSYISSKIENIRKMINYKGINQIEREAAEKLIKQILPQVKQKTLDQPFLQTH